VATAGAQHDVAERDVDRDVVERRTVGSDEGVGPNEGVGSDEVVGSDGVERSDEVVGPDEAVGSDGVERSDEVEGPDEAVGSDEVEGPDEAVRSDDGVRSDAAVGSDRAARSDEDDFVERDAVELDEPEFERDGNQEEDLDEAPSPLEHATPDVELAEVQVALGRSEAADEAEPADYEGQDALEEEDALEQESDDYALDESDGDAVGRELAPARARSAAPRKTSGNRLINFLQGSWRELQRVQWPDRRQVMQATGVVIGFVIVAGLYLGAADTLSSKLVNLLLK
jgi:preprotein translocase SecE subunit